MKSSQLFFVLFISIALAQVPWVFFAKVNGTYEPLSGTYLKNRFEKLSMFTYGNPSALPTELSFKDKVAYTTQTLRPQAVGYFSGNLVFGYNVPATRLDFDEDWKLLAGPFYSCHLVGTSVRVISQKEDPSVSCLEVQIYLFPYDPVRKSIIKPVKLSSARQNQDHPPWDETKCPIKYSGDHVREDLAEYLRDYNGECDIYVNGVLAYRKGARV